MKRESNFINQVVRFFRILKWFSILVFRECPSGVGRIGPLFALELAKTLA